MLQVCLLKCIHTCIMLGTSVSDSPSPSKESDKTPGTNVVLYFVPPFVVLVIAVCGVILCIAIFCFIWKSRSTTGAG